MKISRVDIGLAQGVYFVKLDSKLNVHLEASKGKDKVVNINS